MESIRCFIALDLEEDLRNDISRQQTIFTRQVKGFKWVDPEDYHLTLKFLGSVRKERVQEVGDLLEGIGLQQDPFPVTLQGISAFPYQSNPRVIWVGVRDQSGQLENLWQEIDTGLVDLGFPRDDREFTPHLTLGRVKANRSQGDLTYLFQRFRGRKFGTSLIDSITFYRTELQKSGPKYTVLSRIDLD